jgi:hypothetical protein
LRRKPVRRDEVRVYRRVNGDGKPQWLVTMPAGTYRIEERGQYRGQYFVGDPALWQPLMDELAAQYAAEHEYPHQKGPAGPGPLPLPTLEIFISNGFKYHCEHCGVRFLAHRIAGNKVRLCSDKCGRERRNAKQRQRRATNPAGSSPPASPRPRPAKR